MMPVYRYMDSNSHQRNHAPFTQHYFPGFETVPPQLKVDPSKPPMMYESWPCSSNYGYSVPYHGCCNHGNFPGYYSFRPPCPHFAQSPPTFHHYPNYPTFPEAYHPEYYVPSPHPSHEQPRYEYDKDAHTNHHCCGCPNHPCYQKNERSLKIEEQEPDADAERKGRDSVVPIQPKSYQYPVVWIPPEYIKNKEYAKRADQPEVNEWDAAPRSTKPSKSLKAAEEEPKVWNGRFPLDMNFFKSLMQGEGEKKAPNQQNEEKMRQFPFPIIWVPCDGKQEEGGNQDKRRMKTASDCSKQAPVSEEFLAVEPSVNDVRMEKPQSNEDTSHDKKCVPVKQQMEVQTEDRSEGTKRRRDVTVKRIEDPAKNETGVTTTKRKSPSPPKTSMLPPVCLRVDPLPKKKNGNGSPRSPSPPKGLPQDTMTEASAEPSSKEQVAVNTQNLSGSLDKVEPGKEERKNIQVIEKKPTENKAGECTSGSDQAQVLTNLPINSQEMSGKGTTERNEKESHESRTEEKKIASHEQVVGAENVAETLKATNPEESAHGQCKAEIKRMSDAEAAKLIQSAYRGFEVRKWEPLKKLKEIVKVREQVEEVRNSIRALESSSDLNNDDRRRLVIGEMIMSLLLKLDTIQGLHSSVRDARKSLARELVTLQERLDSLTSKRAEEEVKELATSESAEYPRVDGCRNANIEKENENASAVCISSIEGINEDGNNIEDPDQENLAHTSDRKSDEQNEQTRGPLIQQQQSDVKVDDETTQATADIQCQAVPPMPIMELENEASNVKVQDGTTTQNEDVPPNLDHVAHPPSVTEQKSDADEFSEEKLNANEYAEARDLIREGKLKGGEENDLIPVNNNSEEDKLMSLPNKMINGVHAVCEPEKQIENSNGEEESDLPFNPVCTENNEDIDLLEELPLGIVDEETAISEFEECELHEIGGSNMFPTEVHLGGCQADVQPFEAASDNCVKDQEQNEFSKNPEIEIAVEQTQEKDVEGDNNFESVLKPEEVPFTAGVENNGKVHEEEDDKGGLPVDHMAASGFEAGSITTREKEVLFEEKKEELDQLVKTVEKEKTKQENDIEVQESACVDSNNKATDMPPQTSEERIHVRTDDISEPSTEQELPASPADEDNKLIEENKKLREMMEKLMEAGKDQLSVISNLTERVKELEEKLSKSKKTSKARHRKAIKSPSHCRPIRVKPRTADVAVLLPRTTSGTCPS